MTKSPAQIAIDCLRHEGVTTVFGLDGDHVIYLYDALADFPDIDVINVMHENNASIAAELGTTPVRRQD
jgi:thiamine pyrophosphate-dependent acetolactate synthase large subunit-like protein